MPSERVQRRIDAILNKADAALANRDWRAAKELAGAALGFDPDNEDAQAFLSATDRAIAEPTDNDPSSTVSAVLPKGTDSVPESDKSDTPTSLFADDRYQVSKFWARAAKRGSTWRMTRCWTEKWPSP